MSELRNLTSQEVLKKRLETDAEPRRTLSFYQYQLIENPQQFRDKLYEKLEKLGVLGRIYIANEGINAQISVPEKNFQAFKDYLYSIDFLNGVRLNIALEDDGKSFWVLNVKVRKKIVADGIDDPSFSMQKRGAYLNAKEFNELTENPETVVVDVRNYYEYEVGHFENALEVSSDTFREQLPRAVEMLEDKKDKPIIMYCTGGIRCEKASAFLLHYGFTKVFHLEGGIIEYVREVKEQNLENKFKGKNFVFDNRLGEQITDEVISHCHQCGEKSDTHRNCENIACHLLFIQCDNCYEKFQGCCSDECVTISNLPREEQKKLRRTQKGKSDTFNNSQSRLRARFFDVRNK
ncbi:MAG: rhodanese-related sulfurtransferase [Acidobacteria bacterium]|nr:rhodanese-related sulfurtransferase [Acidobacteriota bacterium]MCA1640065.1 rhodanese-related sulfurtransferase [Acidobacteriota bacterium]